MATAEQHDITVGAAKVASAWGAIAITSWTDIAAALAALYTLLMILDLWWRRFGRNWAEERGWMQKRKRRATDREDADE